MNVLLVVLGAAVGAPLRYLVDRFISVRHDSLFPWGTWCVNVTGSFVLGLLATSAAADAVSPATVALLGTGLCGALTTYSTFSFETVRLVESGSWLYASANVGLSIAACLGAAYGGAAVAHAVWA